MADREILIPAIDPLELFGPNNNKFKLICSRFPKLKIVARGNIIKANAKSGHPVLIPNSEKAALTSKFAPVQLSSGEKVQVNFNQNASAAK